MPSTYSSNLRLELIASGEQANTWGNTSNTNFGILLEEAITGNVQIDISAGNKVLTALNGAYDEARAMVIIATGSAGVTRTITTPANVSKVYILHNDSTTDVTIKTAAAGTPLGVTAPAGTAKLVYTDGTDFFEANNAADVFEAGTVTISGTPTNSTDAITVGAVNTLLGTYLPKSGGTMTGAINMGTTNRITNLASPSASTDAANRAYVDAQVGGSGFASGTKMIFANPSPPVGWTPDITKNNYAMRIVSGSGGGTGGSVGFTSAFTSQPVTGSVSLGSISVSGTTGGWTLSESQIPSHFHNVPGSHGFVITGGGPFAQAPGSGNFSFVTNTANTGGGGAHSHSFSGSASGSATFSGNAINLAVQYVDMILATKD